MFEIRSDRRSLALQVRDGIREYIQQQSLRAGDQLPSEEKLATLFGVSRATLREALKLLEEERVIFCRHGAGRFLTADPASVLVEDITRLQSVTKMAQGLGIEVTTQVLALREETATEEVRARLKVESNARVWALERARQAQGETVIYSVDIFPASLARGEIALESFGGSLVAVMERQWGLRLAYARAQIRAVLLDPALSVRLGVDGRQPWLLLEHVNYDDHDRPILYSTDYYRSDKIAFHVLRRRK